MLERSAASAGVPAKQMSGLSIYNSILGGSVIIAYVLAVIHTHTHTHTFHSVTLPTRLLRSPIQLSAIHAVGMKVNEQHSKSRADSYRVLNCFHHFVHLCVRVIASVTVEDLCNVASIFRPSTAQRGLIVLVHEGL